MRTFLEVECARAALYAIILSSNFFGSFGIFLGTWPAPADNLNEDIHGIDLIGNVGNTATRDAQGFIVTLGASATNCFNAILTVYFLMIVKYGWTETRLRKIEPIFHVYGAVLPIGTSAVFLVMGWYNTAILTCFVMAYLSLGVLFG